MTVVTICSDLGAQESKICHCFHFPFYLKVKVESEKFGLKLNIQKTKIMASSPTTSWEMGKQWRQCQTLFFWAPKSLQKVIAAMKLKDACSLEEKL